MGATIRSASGHGRLSLRHRLLGLLSLVLVVIALTPDRASAHRNDESYLYLDVGDSSLSGRVELPYPDLREVFGLELAGSSADIRAEIEANLETLQTYADANTTVGTATTEWRVTFDGYELLEEKDNVKPTGLGYVLLPFVVDLATGSVPQVIDITFTPFLAEIPDRNNVALVANDWKRGVIEEEANELLVLTDDSPSGTIDLGNASQWKNFRSSTDLGVDHIRTGPDHIFFVLVLLLSSVLVLTGTRWRPTEKLTQSLLRILLVATMFTLAHSITFTLAGLDILPLPPSKLVETIIALSIAAAALYNLKPMFGHREWLIAFGFGLFHGMGFAGLVGDLDVSRTTQLVSLIGRNVGIEIGQLVIILITFPTLFVLRRTRVYRPIFIVSSIALAVLSLAWVVERVGEVDLNFNGAIAEILKWPRSFAAMVVVFVLAVAYRQFESSRGRLIPLGGEADGTSAGVHDADHEPVRV